MASITIEDITKPKISSKKTKDSSDDNSVDHLEEEEEVKDSKKVKDYIERNFYNPNSQFLREYMTETSGLTKLLMLKYKSIISKVSSFDFSSYKLARGKREFNMDAWKCGGNIQFVTKAMIKYADSKHENIVKYSFLQLYIYLKYSSNMKERLIVKNAFGKSFSLSKVDNSALTEKEIYALSVENKYNYYLELLFSILKTKSGRDLLEIDETKRRLTLQYFGLVKKEGTLVKFRSFDFSKLGLTEIKEAAAEENGFIMAWTLHKDTTDAKLYVFSKPFVDNSKVLATIDGKKLVVGKSKFW